MGKVIKEIMEIMERRNREGKGKVIKKRWREAIKEERERGLGDL